MVPLVRFNFNFNFNCSFCFFFLFPFFLLISRPLLMFVVRSIYRFDAPFKTKRNKNKNKKKTKCLIQWSKSTLLNCRYQIVLCCMNAFGATKSTQINYLSLIHQNRFNKPSFGQRIRSRRPRCKRSICWCHRWPRHNCRHHHHWPRSSWAPIILPRARHCIRWIPFALVEALCARAY